MSTALPVHFPIPGQKHCRIYLAPSELLWDILPLTADHPNRLNLTVRRVDAGKRFGASPSCRVLDAASTIKALVYLTLRVTPHRNGLALLWNLSLLEFTTLPVGLTLRPEVFEDEPLIGKVCRQYWEDLMEERKTVKQCRTDALRVLDAIEPLDKAGLSRSE